MRLYKTEPIQCRTAVRLLAVPAYKQADSGNRHRSMIRAGGPGYVLLCWTHQSGVECRRQFLDRAYIGRGSRQPLNHFNMRFLDRKSTRLNSSHLGISYAVFSLKKK